MHSSLKLKESDPHDVFAIAQDIARASWADKVVADIARDPGTRSESVPAVQPPPAAAGAPAPKVDTTFRATVANDVPVPNIPIPEIQVDRPSVPPPGSGRVKKAFKVFLFALCSALAAAGWQHYGGAARQMIAAWTPAFALTSPPTEKTGLTAQPDAPAVQEAAADQAPAQPGGTAPATVAPSPDAEKLQSMARDLAAMGAQVEQLKASLAELKASQQAMAREELKPAAVKPVVQAPQPRPPVPPRPLAARRPYPAFPPAQAAAPPQQLAPPAPPPPMPPPPATAQYDNDGPVVRPPMPLR